MRPHKTLGFRSPRAKQLSQPAGTLLLLLNEIPCCGTPLQALRAGAVPVQLLSAAGAIFALTGLLMYEKSSCGSEGNIKVLGFKKARSNKYFNKIPLFCTTALG